MAASATKKGDYLIPGGNGKRVEYGSITFDSDATVEVSTTLSRVEAVIFTLCKSGGTGGDPSVDETVSDSGITVSGNAITVDVSGASTDTYLYTLIGY